MKKQIILNKEQINNTINRISFSIIEQYYLEKTITIIGFERNGYIIAEKIKKIISSNHKMQISTHRITLEKNNSYTIDPTLKNEEVKNVFLVDDVLKSGKTIIYGIKLNVT